MTTMVYQSFPDEENGDSDSPNKLNAMNLPKRLDGKRVLDIGCNEGYFCIEAKRRGASRVVGIDMNPEFIEKARNRAKGLEIEFLCQSWDNGLPQEEFDYVFLLSALHYGRDKQKLIDEIHSILAPNGELLLELGEVYSHYAMWTRTKRAHHGTVLHPTHKLVDQCLLRNFVYRHVHTSVDQKGDPVQRKIYRCSKFKPIALLITDNYNNGKTTLARELSRTGDCTVFPLDSYIADVARNESFSPELTKFILNRLSRGLAFVAQELPESSLFEEFINGAVETMPDHERLLIIEGFCLKEPGIQERIVSTLEKRGYII